MKDLEDMTEPELREMTTSILNAIAVRLPPATHFAVVFWPPGDYKVGQYGSNCERAGMIKSLREVADRLERRQDVPR